MKLVQTFFDYPSNWWGLLWPWTPDKYSANSWSFGGGGERLFTFILATYLICFLFFGLITLGFFLVGWMCRPHTLLWTFRFGVTHTVMDIQIWRSQSLVNQHVILCHLGLFGAASLQSGYCLRLWRKEVFSLVYGIYSDYLGALGSA